MSHLESKRMLSYSVFLLLLTLPISQSIADNQSTLEKCIVAIYERSVNKVKSQTLYIHGDETKAFINFKFPTVHYTYKRPIRKFKHFKKFDTFIVFVTEARIKEMFTFLAKLDTWNPRAKMLIVYDGDVKMLLQIISIYHIYNVLILKQLSDALIEFYTYFPYQHENYNKPMLSAYKIGNCDDVANINLFPKKLPKFWRNSSAFIAYMPLYPYVECPPCGTGIEVVLVRMLSEKLGFKVKYDEIMYSNWGVKKADGTYEGAIEAVRTKRADFVIGYFHLREYDHLIDFDYTFSHIEDDLAWAMPSPLPLSHWANLINIFEPNTWIFIFTSLTLAAIFWLIFGKLNERGYLHSFYVLEVPFRLLLLIAIPVGPRKLPTKLIYVSTWSFCFIITTVWNSYLIFFLTHESYERQIQSTAELVNSSLVLGIHPELAAMYKNSNSTTGLRIYSKYYECDPTYKCLDRTAYKRDMSTITTHRIFKYILPEKYQNAKGRNMIELLSESVVKDYGVFYFQKGHPLYERLNPLLILLRGAGYVRYLDDHTDFRNAMIHRNALFATHLFETSVLELTQMAGPFYLLMVGWTCAFAVFLIEVLCYKLNKKHLHK